MGNAFSTFPGRPEPRPPKGRRRDLVQLSSHQKVLRDLMIPWFSAVKTRVFGQGPSVFVKTPNEHLIDAQDARKKMAWTIQKYYRRPPPPPGYITVQLFESVDAARMWERIPNSMVLVPPTAEVPLEAGGGLDLRKVKALWGLETCVPLDPMRLKAFIPGSEPDSLSALAVGCLSQCHHTIKFIEPSVSAPTRTKRKIRITLLPLVLSLYLFFVAAASLGGGFLRRHTSVLEWCSGASEYRRVMVWRAREWVSEHEELCRLFKAWLVVAMVLIILSTVQGYIDVGVCVRTWIPQRAESILF